MRTENGQIKGDLVVSEEVWLNGQVTGSILVVDGGVLNLHGMCAGNLTVNRGGRASIAGMVCGDLIRNGGEAEIRGMVCGTVRSGVGTS
ncbi:MAG: hypothetical protein QM674_01755 [Burkholderiaceae bacterium]